MLEVNSSNTCLEDPHQPKFVHLRDSDSYKNPSMQKTKGRDRGGCSVKTDFVKVLIFPDFVNNFPDFSPSSLPYFPIFWPCEITTLIWPVSASVKRLELQTNPEKICMELTILCTAEVDVIKLNGN